jgi:ribonuclease HI
MKPIISSPQKVYDFTIYTDGSCAENPGGKGGWAAIVGNRFGEEWVLVGSDPSTTNNRMEVRAAIEGIRLTPEGCRVLVITDSQYLQKGASCWIGKWRKKNFKKVKNPDLWRELDELRKTRGCDFEWVRGHSGDVMNERCDELANRQAGIRPLVDADPMPFGRYKGRPLKDVPDDYLRWLFENGLRNDHRPIGDYVRARNTPDQLSPDGGANPINQSQLWKPRPA